MHMCIYPSMVLTIRRYTHREGDSTMTKQLLMEMRMELGLAAVGFSFIAVLCCV